MFDFLSGKFSGILQWLQGKGRLSDDNIEDACTEVHDALLEADVPYHIITEFLAQVRSDVVGQKISTTVNPGNKFIKIVHDRMLAFLKGEQAVAALVHFDIPSVIMVLGLQGSGKTTTVAKLARWLTKEAAKRGKKRKILCGSIDFYRPAAIDQLEVLAKSVAIDFFRPQETEPLKAARALLHKFKEGYDYLLLDTAGRLHVDNAMLEELSAVNALVQPKYKALVLDAMTGQESLNVARAFDQAVGFDGAILTKMDSETRGGAAFAFAYALKKPIWFIGSGEKVDDLELFAPDRMASRMLGMGDIVSLMEKADEQLDRPTQESMAKRFMEGQFSLDDFAQQLTMVSNLGPIQKVLKYLPGMPSISAQQMEDGQKEMKRFRAILSSMTRKERLFPDVLNGSRRLRIAKGSGTSVEDVNKLLARFEQSKQFAKMLKKGGKLGKFF